jgi:hypothetical protein
LFEFIYCSYYIDWQKYLKNFVAHSKTSKGHFKTMTRKLKCMRNSSKIGKGWKQNIYRVYAYGIVIYIYCTCICSWYNYKHVRAVVYIVAAVDVLLSCWCFGRCILISFIFSFVFSCDVWCVRCLFCFKLLIFQLTVDYFVWN